MAIVANVSDNESALSVSAVLCVDGDGFDRMGRILRHLAVGLVDQAVNVRLMGPDPRIQSVALGPIQSIVHGPIAWPSARRRIREAIDAVSDRPPTICHALSPSSCRVAAALAEAFDADLVLQVASLADCEAVSRPADRPVTRYVACSDALAEILENQLQIPADKIELIRPGLLASKRPACFARPDRDTTVLCTAPLEKDSGVDRLIEAAAILRKRGRPMLVFLLGRGKHETALRSFVRHLGLSAQIMIAQPIGDIEEAMKSADVFVRPSMGTSFDIDALQAMAAGMVVVTMANTICDYFRGGETAVICEKATAESLADGIEQVLSNRDAARKMASGALEYIRENHAMSLMAEKTARVYRELALARATFSIAE